MDCPHCNTSNNHTARICWSCGRDLPRQDRRLSASQGRSPVLSRQGSVAKCPMCKEPVKSGAVVCPHCNTKILTKKEIEREIKQNKIGSICILTTLLLLIAFFVFGFASGFNMPGPTYIVNMAVIFGLGFYRQKAKKRIAELEELARASGFQK